ncbi:MAG: hypothetical protein RBS68_11255 [Anaerolineales bacterium]|jgi:hypothetical protein|nr:hypothetical protein [Anaerolineales bacterium]
MLTALYGFYTIAVTAQIIAALRLFSRRSAKNSAYLGVLLVVLIGLLYDNAIIALGAIIGEGWFLHTLSVGRYIGHAFGTPLLLIFAFGVARRAGLGWAQAKTAHALLCLFTTLLIGIGVFNDIVRLELTPRPLLDILRYVNIAPKGPPIPSIATILGLLVMSAALWRSTGWAWLAVGALFMFIAAVIGMRDWMFLSNFGEVVLGLACLGAAKKFLRPE